MIPLIKALSNYKTMNEIYVMLINDGLSIVEVTKLIEQATNELKRESNLEYTLESLPYPQLKKFIKRDCKVKKGKPINNIDSLLWGATCMAIKKLSDSLPSNELLSSKGHNSLSRTYSTKVTIEELPYHLCIYSIKDEYVVIADNSATHIGYILAVSPRLKKYLPTLRTYAPNFGSAIKNHNCGNTILNS